VFKNSPFPIIVFEHPLTTFPDESFLCSPQLTELVLVMFSPSVLAFGNTFAALGEISELEVTEIRPPPPLWPDGRKYSQTLPSPDPNLVLARFTLKLTHYLYVVE